MIMRLVKAAALVWLAKKVREKAFSTKPGQRRTAPQRSSAKA